MLQYESPFQDAAEDHPGEDLAQSNVKIMCRLCYARENDGSEKARKMLPCKSCNKKYHRSCLKSWPQNRDLFHWSSWTCPSCRTCEVCRRTGDHTKFMFRKRCDGAHHCYCQQPPHKIQKDEVQQMLCNALEEISMEKHYQEKCLSMLIHAVQSSEASTMDNGLKSGAKRKYVLSKYQLVVTSVLMATLPRHFPEILHCYFKGGLEDLSTFMDIDQEEDDKSQDKEDMDLGLTSMAEDAYASAIFLLLKDKVYNLAGDDFRSSVLQPIKGWIQFVACLLHMPSETALLREVVALLPSDDDAVEKRRPYTNGINNRRENNTGGRRNETVTIETEGAQSLPIPLPGLPRNDSLERESNYMSARSLSKSHTPPVGSFLSQMMISAPAYRGTSLEEPFLSENESQSAPPSKTKTMLCVLSAVSLFLGTLNLHLTERSMHNMVFEKPGQGVIIPLGIRLLQASENVLLKSGGTGSSGVGTYLGWAMAIIYMGGRLPQIWLNELRRLFREGQVTLEENEGEVNAAAVTAARSCEENEGEVILNDV